MNFIYNDISILAATTYISLRLYTDAWDVATDANKEKALHMAERLIESVPWRGQPYDLDEDDQPGKWPRVIDGVTKDWDDDESEAVVPEEIIFAIYEEALAILQIGNSGRQKLRSEGVKSFSISGKVSETFVTAKDQSEMEELGFKSPEAYRLVKRWIYRGGPVH